MHLSQVVEPVDCWIFSIFAMDDNAKGRANSPNSLLHRHNLAGLGAIVLCCEIYSAVLWNVNCKHLSKMYSNLQGFPSNWPHTLNILCTQSMWKHHFFWDPYTASFIEMTLSGSVFCCNTATKNPSLQEYWEQLIICRVLILQISGIFKQTSQTLSTLVFLAFWSGLNFLCSLPDIHKCKHTTDMTFLASQLPTHIHNMSVCAFVISCIGSHHPTILLKEFVHSLGSSVSTVTTLDVHSEDAFSGSFSAANQWASPRTFWYVSCHHWKVWPFGDMSHCAFFNTLGEACPLLIELIMAAMISHTFCLSCCNSQGTSQESMRW